MGLKRAKAAPGVAARRLALHWLGEVLDRHKAFDEVSAHGGGELEPRDRAFAYVLVATTLRRLGQIDAALDTCLDRPLTGPARAVRNLMRLGAAQLLFLATPAHAALDATVALAEGEGRGGLRPFRALVNAVLRRLSREGADMVAAQDAEPLNTPDWLWASWAAAHGEAGARAIARAHLGEPPLDISVKGDPARWAEALEATVLPTGGLRRIGHGRIEDLPGFAEGAWWVQDAAASLPVALLGDVAGAHVLDLCAAPGGKTALLAAKGARVTALDRSAPRLERLRANLARLRLEAETIVADAAAWRPDAPAPFVLLDAPCSATGTIRRHPDVARAKGPEDVAKLAATQARLLVAALEMTAPGGTLVYATCSLEPEEGEAQIARLIADGAPVARRPIACDELPGLSEAVTADGDLRTLPSMWPERGGLDGFYAARLTRL
jgi:16S rRNA (cytosine967-C5)-methyltransferase